MSSQNANSQDTVENRVSTLETGLVPKFPTLIVSTVLGLSSILSALCGLILDTIANNARKDFELKMNIIKMLLSQKVGECDE